MSISARDWAWEQDLPPITKIVLLALAERADDVGVCWPSLNALAKHCRISRPTVCRHIDALAAGGFIKEREHQHRDDGSQTNTRYQLALPAKNVTPLLKSVTPLSVQADTPVTLREHPVNPALQRTKPSVTVNSPSTSLPVLSEPTETSMSAAAPKSKTERPKRAPPEVPPDLQAVCDRWVALGLGPISQTAKQGLRLLIAEHNRELVEQGLERAAEQGIKWPVSWLKVCIPAWKREGQRNERPATTATPATVPRPPSKFRDEFAAFLGRA